MSVGTNQVPVSTVTKICDLESGQTVLISNIKKGSPITRAMVLEFRLGPYDGFAYVVVEIGKERFGSC